MSPLTRPVSCPRATLPPAVGGEAAAFRAAAERVAGSLGARLTGAELVAGDFFGRALVFLRDRNGREYLVRRAGRRRGFHVSVSAPVRRRLHVRRVEQRAFLVRGRAVFLYTDFGLMADYLDFFLRRRRYRPSPGHRRVVIDLPFLKIARGQFPVDGASGQYTLRIFRGRCQAWLRDGNPAEPFLCAAGAQYVFHFRPRLPLRDGRLDPAGLLRTYDETEIKSSSPGPLALLKRGFYGFGSENLRAFYAGGGLMPEARQAVLTTFFLALAASLVNASVFVRVAERLAGNAWYVLAAGVLVFLRVPAEMVNMRRSLRITRDLPGSRLRKISRGEDFRALFETRPFRLWRNFETAWQDLFRGTELFAVKLEQYRLLKPTLVEKVRAGRAGEVPALLAAGLDLDRERLAGITAAAVRLEPLDGGQVHRVFAERIRRLKTAGLLRPSEWRTIDDYVRDLPAQLERYTVSGVFADFSDMLKRAERAPTPQELFTLVGACRQAILPLRRADLLLLLSLFLIGYGASYVPGMAVVVFPLFYVFHGLVTQLIASGSERFGNPVWMQYVFKELENDPAVPSAADVWNEFNSQLMRLFTMATSLGIIIGLSGRLLAGLTRNVSWFGVEALALFLHLCGFKAWRDFYRGLQSRCHGRESAGPPAG